MFAVEHSGEVSLSYFTSVECVHLWVKGRGVSSATLFICFFLLSPPLSQRLMPLLCFQHLTDCPLSLSSAEFADVLMAVLTSCGLEIWATFITSPEM